MNFQPHLAALVMDGTKTVTRRQMSDKPRSPWNRNHCTSRPGRSEAVTKGRGKGPAVGRIMVLAVDAVRLGDITEAEARAEGVGSVAEFEAIWSNINGGWDADELVWRVEFEVLTSKHEPFTLGHELTVADAIVLARRACCDPGAFTKRIFRDPAIWESDDEPLHLWQARAVTIALGPRCSELGEKWGGIATLGTRHDGVAVEEAAEVLAEVARA